MEQEAPETLRLAPFDAPARILSRGFGAGTGPEEPALCAGRSAIRAADGTWANLYVVFAVAIEARLNGPPIRDGLLHYPDLRDDARGVRFEEAAVAAAAWGGAWVDCALAP